MKEDLGVTSIPNCHAKRQNDVFTSTFAPNPEIFRCDQITLCYKTSYIGTIGNTATLKSLPTIP